MWPPEGETEAYETYCGVYGTSYASPIAAGSVALLAGRWRDADGTWEPGLCLVNRLLDAASAPATASDPPTVEDGEWLGRGILDARAAITDRVVRLGGETQFETSRTIGREAFPASRTESARIADRAVMVPADTFDPPLEGDQAIGVGWKSALPSAGLLAVDERLSRASRKRAL